MIEEKTKVIKLYKDNPNAEKELRDYYICYVCKVRYPLRKVSKGKYLCEKHFKGEGK